MIKRIALCLAFSVSVALAAETALEFDSRDQQFRYYDLIEEIRCMVCQNQNIADSNAELAQDLRDRVYDMVRAGRSNEFIIGHLVERYGDFVLYRPPLKLATLLLWFGPLVFLIVAALTLWVYIRRSRYQSKSALSEDERLRARKILEQ